MKEECAWCGADATTEIEVEGLDGADHTAHLCEACFFRWRRYIVAEEADVEEKQQ